MLALVAGLLLAADACASGTAEQPRKDSSIAVRPRKAVVKPAAARQVLEENAALSSGCALALSALAALPWAEARGLAAEHEGSPCMDEAKVALTTFPDAKAFRDWLAENDLADGLPKDATVVSVRHALYAAGHVVGIDLEQSAQPPLRPVDGMGAIAAMAPELKGARYLDGLPSPGGCSLLKKRQDCDHPCHPTVPLAVQLGKRCISLELEALACSGDMMSPYVVQQTQLLNRVLDEFVSSRRFVLLDGGATVVFGSKAGLEAAQQQKLLSAD